MEGVAPWLRYPTGRTEALTEAYRKLREHASGYRATTTFGTARDRWQENREDQRAYTKHAVHEFYARGIEAAARTLAEMLELPEHEIEEAGRG